MINMDFSAVVVIDTKEADWIDSPAPGVQRKLLAREESERGHATSVVRYLPGAEFKPHDHPKGEEIFVLEGVFSDETGDYHAGAYFRNPEGFRHGPFSEDGCTILVKLHQFQESDSEHVCIQTDQSEWVDCDGYEQLPLHKHDHEEVALLKISEGNTVLLDAGRGGELFVVSGKLESSIGRLSEECWCRLVNDSLAIKAIEDTLVWVKTGHIF